MTRNDFLRTLAWLLFTSIFFLYSGCEDSGLSPSPETVIINSEVALTNLKEGDVISGSFKIQVSTPENIEVDSIQVYADKQLLGSDYSEPWNIEWDTTKFKDGKYRLLALAHSIKNGQFESENIQVRVVNNL